MIELLVIGKFNPTVSDVATAVTLNPWQPGAGISDCVPERAIILGCSLAGPYRYLAGCQPVGSSRGTQRSNIFKYLQIFSSISKYLNYQIVTVRGLTFLNNIHHSLSV